MPNSRPIHFLIVNDNGYPDLFVISTVTIFPSQIRKSDIATRCESTATSIRTSIRGRASRRIASGTTASGLPREITWSSQTQTTSAATRAASQTSATTSRARDQILAQSTSSPSTTLEIPGANTLHQLDSRTVQVHFILLVKLIDSRAFNKF